MRYVASIIADSLYALHGRFGLLRCRSMAKLEDRLRAYAYPDKE